MSLVIESAETEALARRLSDALGVSPEEAIARALKEQLSGVGEDRPSPDDVKAAIAAIQQRVAALPTLAEGTDDDLLGYNNAGHFD
jgi:hypothetical protein